MYLNVYWRIVISPLIIFHCILSYHMVVWWSWEEKGLKLQKFYSSLISSTLKVQEWPNFSSTPSRQQTSTLDQSSTGTLLCLEDPPCILDFLHVKRERERSRETVPSQGAHCQVISKCLKGVGSAWRRCNGFEFFVCT